MTNNDKTIALKWANAVLDDLDHYAPIEHAAARHIIKTTPSPTMAELDWKDNEHTLAGATLDIGDGPENVIMTAHSGVYIFYVTKDGKPDYDYSRFFTPNGKRYELHEAGTADVTPPKTLTTEKDYNEAADGTVAASPDGMPFLKQRSVWRYLNIVKRDDEMANAQPRVVLRDGWNG